MTQKKQLRMARGEIELVLNTMLNPTKVRSINANQNLLSVQQQDELYDIVPKVLNGGLNISGAVTIVSDILTAVGYGANTKKVKVKTNKSVKPVFATVNQDTMPFLIKQVLFFLGCLYVSQSTETQKDFLILLNNADINITHNFFTKLGYSVQYFADILEYEQPHTPIPYKGQKNGELAVAIKNLVYQAGTGIDYFVDIFGGSGSASTAVCPKKGVQVVYNELSTSVFNLFEVMWDKDLHKDLIRHLKMLQDDLKFGKPYIEDISQDIVIKDEDLPYKIEDFLVLDFDIQSELYRNSKKKGISPTEITIKDEFSEDIYTKNDDIVKIMNFYRQDVEKQNADYEFIWRSKTYSKNQLLKYQGLSGYFGIVNGKLLTPIVHAYLKHSLSAAAYISFFSTIPAYRKLEFNESNISGEDLISAQKKHIQFRFYRYYTFFWRLRKNNIIPQGDKVLYAVAEYFIQSLITSGNIGLSPVLRMYKYSIQDNRILDKSTHNFMHSDHSTLIKNFHNRIKKFKLLNTNALEVIAQYHALAKENNKKLLIYSDSPYLATSDYKENNVAPFKRADMRDLINELMKVEQKFVFSCRACTTVKSKDIVKDIKKKNGIIYEYVFEVFKSYSKSYRRELFVLVIETFGKDLGKLVSENKAPEIMITNYQISDIFDFNNENGGERRIKYKVYKFNDFISIIDTHMNK